MGEEIGNGTGNASIEDETPEDLENAAIPDTEEKETATDHNIAAYELPDYSKSIETGNDTVMEDINTSLNNKLDVEMAEDVPADYSNDGNLFKDGKIIELSRCSWVSTDVKQQYLRGCVWSPDGTCILTAVNSDGMHVIELPSDLYHAKKITPERPVDILQSAVHVKEGGTVYDYCWYPFMNSSAPETCCWLATRQHEPIHMWDAFNGELRCSYKGYDAVDEVEAAISVAFSSDGERVIGGYKKNIKVFNTNVPGRIYDEIATKQPVSCFGIHDLHKDTIVTGSWNCSINLYDFRIPKLGSLATFSEHVGGVTCLKFSKSGETLFSGARKDNNIFEWDMRNFSAPITVLKRNVATNQKIYFDISSRGQWLASGDTSGIARVWDMQEDFKEYQFALHKDCCNGVGFHESYPVLATTAGQYHFVTEEDRSETGVKMYENSIIFWWCGDIEIVSR